MICNYKELRYVTVLVTVGMVLLITLTNIDNPYLKITNSEYVPRDEHYVDKFIDFNASVSVTPQTVSPEAALDILCQGIDTVNRSTLTSLTFTKVKISEADIFRKIHVFIHTYDHMNESKTSGNDVIVIWANQIAGDGLVSGHVIDHKNGSYTGIVKVFWTGITNVSVKLASSSETTCLRFKALRKYGNTVFAMQQPWGIRGLFQNNYMNELTACGANPRLYGFGNLCNFTSLNGGMSWFCGHPRQQTLFCSDIYSFGTGKFDTKRVPQNEKIQNVGHGIFKRYLTLKVQQISQESINTNISCKMRPPLQSWKEPKPTGFWSNNQWNLANCYSYISHTYTSYGDCLQNKSVVIIGDSTLRQYAEYFIDKVLGLGPVDMKYGLGNNRQYHDNRLFSNIGIDLMYIKHEMPFHNPNFPANGIVSMPQMLYSMAGNDIEDHKLILVLNYNSHLSAYPPAIFRERLKHLAKAIQNFVKFKPHAKIFFKGPHITIDDTRWFDPRISLLYIQILEEEFYSIMDKVIYLDDWSITVAHNTEDLHPGGNAFTSQINQLMSYIC